MSAHPASSEVTHALRTHPAFARASPATLRALARTASLDVVDAGRVLLRAGTRATHLLLVAEGALELTHPVKGKRGKSVLLGRIDAPTLFGDATLVGSAGVWPVSGRAAVDSLVVHIPLRALDAALDTDAPLAAELYRAACRRHFRSICFRRDLVLHGNRGATAAAARQLRAHAVDADAARAQLGHRPHHGVAPPRAPQKRRARHG